MVQWITGKAVLDPVPHTPDCICDSVAAYHDMVKAVPSNQANELRLMLPQLSSWQVLMTRHRRVCFKELLQCIGTRSNPLLALSALCRCVHSHHGLLRCSAWMDYIVNAATNDSSVTQALATAVTVTQWLPLITRGNQITQDWSQTNDTHHWSILFDWQPQTISFFETHINRIN